MAQGSGSCHGLTRPSSESEVASERGGAKASGMGQGRGAGVRGSAPLARAPSLLAPGPAGGA